MTRMDAVEDEWEEGIAISKLGSKQRSIDGETTTLADLSNAEATTHWLGLVHVHVEIWCWLKKINRVDVDVDYMVLGLRRPSVHR